MFFDIGGWWLTCDHMFRRFGTPFASDWIAKSINGYLYTAAVPADPGVRTEATEYEARYVPRVPRADEYASRTGAYLGWVLPQYAANFLDWWRDRLRPEIERNFAYLDARLEADPSLLELAVLLEDAIDIHDRHWKIHWMLNFAQFSATVGLNATIAEVAGDVDPNLGGRLQSSVEDRNWDSIEALWQMKEEVSADEELRAAFDRRHGGRRHAGTRGLRARPALRRRAARPVPEGVRQQGDLVARVRLPYLARAARTDHRGDPRLLETDYDYPATLAGVKADLEAAVSELMDGVPEGEAKAPASGRARPVPADEPAHTRPSLLHRPGDERVPSARARRDRAPARRGGHPRRPRGRGLPPLQRAPGADGRSVGARREGSGLGSARRAGARVDGSPARLGRHGDDRGARVPVPDVVGLSREVPPAAADESRRGPGSRGLARRGRGHRPDDRLARGGGPASRQARSSSAG